MATATAPPASTATPPVTAIMVEPVGAIMGSVPAPRGYLQIVRDICNRHGVLFIVDEVITGWGRTGKMWGVDHWEVTPPRLSRRNSECS